MRLSHSFKKIFLIVGILFLIAIPSFVFAQQYAIPNAAANVAPSLHNWTQDVFMEVLSAATCQLGGFDPTTPNHQCLTIQNGVVSYANTNGGAIGFLTNSMAYLYTPPLHTGDALAAMTRGFGLAQKAYADNGVGFSGLSPLVPIWTTFRNLVYLLYVIIFIVIGFSIMLRVKIDPRTVMSIENQIPKLIITLILITFSLAIAGFLIDLMWVVTFFVVNIIVSADKTLSAQIATSDLFQNPIGYVNDLFGNSQAGGGFLRVAMESGRSVQQIIANMFSAGGSNQLGLTPPIQQQCGNTFFISGWNCLTSGKIGDILASSLTDLLGTILGWAISWIVGILGMIAVLVALFIAIFRLWFALVLTYVFVILDIILAPFTIAFGLFPGSKTGFGSWLRSLAANLLTFPAVMGVFLLGRVILDQLASTNGSQMFVPPLIGNPDGTNLNLFGQASGTTYGAIANPLGALIGLGIILLAPQIPGIIKGLFKVQDSKAAGGIIKALQPGLDIVNLPKMTTEFGQKMYYLKQVPGYEKFAGKLRNLVKKPHS